jgi:hypothetical protein
MKLDFRTRTSFTITNVSNPITLNSDDFRKVEPPFEGETEAEFYEYISEVLNSWEGEDFIETNKEHFSEEVQEAMYCTFVEYPSIEMFDSRYKSDEVVVDGGKIDKEYTKYGGFNPQYTPKYE